MDVKALIDALSRVDPSKMVCVKWGPEDADHANGRIDENGYCIGENEFLSEPCRPTRIDEGNAALILSIGF